MNNIPLHQALEFVAFGAFNVPLAEQYKHQDKLEYAKQMLRRAFATGRIHLTCGGQEFNFDINYPIDWYSDQICTTYAQIVRDENIKSHICVDMQDLTREFPPTQPSQKKHKTPAPHRPEQRIVHDIAYYIYQNNPHLQAKELHRILCKGLQHYPTLSKKQEPATLCTVESWKTAFKKGKYTPGTEKHKLSAQYPKLFANLKSAF